MKTSSCANAAFVRSTCDAQLARHRRGPLARGDDAPSCYRRSVARGRHRAVGSADRHCQHRRRRAWVPDRSAPRSGQRTLRRRSVAGLQSVSDSDATIGAVAAFAGRRLHSAKSRPMPPVRTVTVRPTAPCDRAKAASNWHSRRARRRCRCPACAIGFERRFPGAIVRVAPSPTSPTILPQIRFRPKRVTEMPRFDGNGMSGTFRFQ